MITKPFTTFPKAPLHVQYNGEHIRHISALNSEKKVSQIACFNSGTVFDLRL